jgi:hypothetical protein
MKAYLAFFLFLFFTTSPLMAQLEQHRWKDRILLLFAPSELQIEYQQQLAGLQKDTIGLADRKLIIYSIFSQSENQQLETTAVAGLQKHYNPEKHSFKILLIGKDGGVKAQQNHPISREELFALIDGMPMRRAEIRRKNGNF